MGSSGIKRRKARRRLPKVRGEIRRPEMNEATSLSPAGVPQAYGNIMRGVRSPHKDQRRAGGVIAGSFGVLFLVAVVVALVAAAIR